MFKLKTDQRGVFGKQLRRVRSTGAMPAVFYGPKDPSTPILLDTKEFKKILKQAGESSIVSLQTPSGAKEVLIKEVAFHPASGEPIHADFYVIEQDKKLEVNVPLEFIGEAPAVKNLAGTLVKVLHELPIEVLPKDLPHDIKVDISTLATLEDQILVKDLNLPTGVEAKVAADEVVAAITVTKEEDELPAEPIDLSSIEVEKKGKPKEEEDATTEPAQ